MEQQLIETETSNKKKKENKETTTNNNNNVKIICNFNVVGEINSLKWISNYIFLEDNLLYVANMDKTIKNFILLNLNKVQDLQDESMQIKFKDELKEHNRQVKFVTKLNGKIISISDDMKIIVWNA